MKMIERNYYSVEFKYLEEDETYFSSKTRFDSSGEAVKYAWTVASNYLRELDLLVSWRVRYCFKFIGGEWSSMIVIKNTDPVDLRFFEQVKEGGKSKQ